MDIASDAKLIALGVAGAAALYFGYASLSSSSSDEAPSFPPGQDPITKAAATDTTSGAVVGVGVVAAASPVAGYHTLTNADALVPIFDENCQVKEWQNADGSKHNGATLDPIYKINALAKRRPVCVAEKAAKDIADEAVIKAKLSELKDPNDSTKIAGLRHEHAMAVAHRPDAVQQNALFSALAANKQVELKQTAMVQTEIKKATLEIHKQAEIVKEQSTPEHARKLAAETQDLIDREKQRKVIAAITAGIVMIDTKLIAHMRANYEQSISGNPNKGSYLRLFDEMADVRVRKLQLGK